MPMRRDQTSGAVTAAIDAFRGGEIVLIVQERSRIAAVATAAERVTASVLRRMSSICGSAVFVVATGDRLDSLGIRSMAGVDANHGYRDFALSINAAGTTGLTDEDRAEVFRRIINPLAMSSDFTWPGHTIPIRARNRGLLARQTVSEAALDLARLAGHFPGSAMGLVFDQGGRTLSAAALRALRTEHGLTMVSVEALARHRLLQETFLETMTDCDLPVGDHIWRLIGYRDIDTGRAHTALVRRPGTVPRAMPLYVQRPCALGLVFGSPTCSCRADLDHAIETMTSIGHGIVIHVDASDLSGQLMLEIAGDAAPAPPEVDAHADIDPRDHIAAGWILRALGIREVEVLPSNADVGMALEAHGIPCGAASIG